MALSQSFKSTSTQTIKLAEMNAVPNTEDLRFMLTESTMQRKPVLLPFKNPANGLSFIVKVSPPIGESGPRWTFERVKDSVQNILWTRETREVAMIQGKLAIDTIYSNTCENTENTTVSTGSPRHSGSFPATPASQENIPGMLDITSTIETTPVQPPQFGFLEPPNYNQPNSPDWFCSFNTSPPESKDLPPPVEFDAKLLETVVASLTDPQTCLATYGAFTYFLLRQFAQYQITTTGFAVVVFEISIMQNGVEMDIPQEVFRTIADRLFPLMSLLDVAARIEDGEFAVLLCNSDGAAAFKFARALYGALSGQSLMPAGIEAEEAIVIGAAALPETCSDPEVLLAAARRAKEDALASTRPYVLH